MDKTVFLKLQCPKCHSPARAKVDKKIYKFLIYVCPVCKSNVVYYDDRVDILSDEFMNTLIKDKNLTFCGDAVFPKVVPSNSNLKDEPITTDRINDFKILLNTEKDLAKFISKM